MEYTLGPATPEDLHAVLNQITTPGELRLWGGPALTVPPTVDHTWREMGVTAQNTFTLIDSEGEVAGIGQILLREKDTAHLARIIVSPVLRGHGIGRVLCQQLIRVGSRSYGAISFALNVYRDNLPAVDLYRSLGFIVIAEYTEQGWFRMLLQAPVLPASQALIPARYATSTPVARASSL